MNAKINLSINICFLCNKCQLHLISTRLQGYLSSCKCLQGQLQSKLTVLLLTSLSALTAAKQYLGDPIHCIFDTRYQHIWVLKDFIKYFDPDLE